jgi:uncharacterized membrane protein SpoIIM required for sporulation/ABC-type transport system involved in multi-copper enzyme maturation permease subunit
MTTDALEVGRIRANRFSLKMAWIIARRELADTVRDWRLVLPILVLVIGFPWLMNWTAETVIDFVQRRDATLIGERLIPFLLMVVGFFPLSFSLIIALETFVGEKERRSMEPLLAMPITDVELYLGKTISATALPLAGSLLAICVYLTGLHLTIGYAPTLELLIQILALNVISAVVMVSGAVVVSSQTTSVRASNLLASFIIVPMALLVQAESIVMFWGNYGTLWIIALGLVLVAVILVRMGVQTFNRESILGREIDELNLRRSGRVFRHHFVQAPGRLPERYSQDRARTSLLRFFRWVGRVYRYDLPYLMHQNWIPVVVVVIALIGVSGLGWAYVANFPLPQGALTLEELSSQDFEALSDVSLLPSLTTWGILSHNVQALLLAALAAVVSLGVLAVLMLMLPIGVVAFLAGEMAWLGYNPLAFLAAFILPHGVLEIPAAIIATAFALRIGASITAPREGLTVGEGLLAAAADFFKVFIFLVVPLLLVAAFVEANITPQIVVWVYGG